MILVWVVSFAVALWLVVMLPFQMAERRGRRGWLYVLLSILISPVIIVPLLWIIGGAPGIHRRQ